MNARSYSLGIYCGHNSAFQGHDLIGGRLGLRGVGFLNAFAGGVIAYLALEAGFS